MNTPWMFVTGVTILGFMLPELLLIFKIKVPVGMNVLSAIAFGLIAASFVY